VREERDRREYLAAVSDEAQPSAPFAKAIGGDDRMPASREIWGQAKLAVEMIAVFLICLFAGRLQKRRHRIKKAATELSLAPRNADDRVDVALDLLDDHRRSIVS
jgi:hypothetical protein